VIPASVRDRDDNLSPGSPALDFKNIVRVKLSTGILIKGVIFTCGVVGRIIIITVGP